MITDTDFLEGLKKLSPEVYTVFEHHNNMEHTQMLRQRIAVGICGMALPVLDYLFTVFFCGWDWRVPSISATYYSPASAVFILVMGASCFFLCSYRGYDFYDFLFAKVAGVSGFALSLFPCSYGGKVWNFLMISSRISNGIHLASAGIFFLSLFIIIFFRFTKMSPVMPTKGKRARNRLYRICGLAMLTFLVVGFGGERVWPHLVGITYLGEALALEAFGAAWLVKGTVLFGE